MQVRTLCPPDRGKPARRICWAVPASPRKPRPRSPTLRPLQEKGFCHIQFSHTRKVKKRVTQEINLNNPQVGPKLIPLN